MYSGTCVLSLSLSLSLPPQKKRKHEHGHAGRAPSKGVSQPEFEGRFAALLYRRRTHAGRKSTESWRGEHGGRKEKEAGTTTGFDVLSRDVRFDEAARPPPRRRVSVSLRELFVPSPPTRQPTRETEKDERTERMEERRKEGRKREGMEERRRTRVK